MLLYETVWYNLGQIQFNSVGVLRQYWQTGYDLLGANDHRKSL